MAASHNKPTCNENRFRRYECKYLIDEARAAEIRRRIEPFVELDPYAANSPDHSYDITSLYLDAPDLRLFRETSEGLKKRLKLRIRSYSDHSDAPAFLEIKRRYDRLVLKGRARLDRTAVADMLAGGVPDTSALCRAELECYDEFTAWTARWFAQPVIWVRYRREAYAGRHNPDVRITLDRGLCCATADSQFTDPPKCGWHHIESRGVILELKFTSAYPDWLSRLVQCAGLQQRSYSKYGNAVLRGLDSHRLPAAEIWSLPLSGGRRIHEHLF